MCNSVGDALNCKEHQDSWSSSYKGTGAVAAGLAVGYKKDFLRVEGESSVRQTYTDPTTAVIRDISLNESIGPIEVKTHMANIYLDVDTMKYVKPFIGVGAGRVEQRYQYVSGRIGADQVISGAGFGAQGIIGLNVPVGDKGDLFIKTRYLRLPDVLSVNEWNGLESPVPTEYMQKLRKRGLVDVSVGFTMF